MSQRRAIGVFGACVSRVLSALVSFKQGAAANKKMQKIKALYSFIAVLLLCLPAVAQERLKMSVMAPGTSSYLVMTNFASLVNAQPNNIEILVDAQGVQTRHMLDLAQGLTNIAMTSPTAMAHMYNATGMYQQQPTSPQDADKLRLLFWFPNGPYHIATKSEDEIFNFQELRGLRIFLGPPGSDDFLTVRDWLQGTVGLEMGVDYTPVASDWLGAVTGFARDEIDVHISPGIPPYSYIGPLSRRTKIRIIGHGDDERQRILSDRGSEGYLVANQPGRAFEPINVSHYNDNVEARGAIFGLGALAGVIVNENLPEETVYQMVKAFWEGKAGIANQAKYLRQVTPEIALSETSVPLHPGALRYYIEAGWQVPDALR